MAIAYAFSTVRLHMQFAEDVIANLQIIVAVSILSNIINTYLIIIKHFQKVNRSEHRRPKVASW